MRIFSFRALLLVLCLVAGGLWARSFTPSAAQAVVPAWYRKCGPLFGPPASPRDGRGNRLKFFEDAPCDWGGWAVDGYGTDLLVDTLSVRSLHRSRGLIGHSSSRQAILLRKGGECLDSVTDVDWKEDRKFLRVAFPTIPLAQEARFVIRPGNVAGPTNDNTEWKYARFESMGRRLANFSEHDRGGVLLNGSKYGYHAKDGGRSLSLLRAPTHPDPVADRGKHHLVYSLLPHKGDLAHSDVLAHAAILNQGVESFPGRALRAPISFPVAVEGEVEFSSRKRGEREDCLVIRLVELLGLHAQARAALPPGTRLVETDLMDQADLGPVEATLPLNFPLISIHTFKLYPQGETPRIPAPFPFPCHLASHTNLI